MGPSNAGVSCERGTDMTITRALAAASFLLLAAPAWADAPVAVVEDVSGKPAGIEFMDYVAAGDAIVRGYLKSCWRETIRGGTVTVGAEQSDVTGGTVDRVKVGCDGGK